jgi:hypothetical protein
MKPLFNRDQPINNENLKNEAWKHFKAGYEAAGRDMRNAIQWAFTLAQGYDEANDEYIESVLHFIEKEQVKRPTAFEVETEGTFDAKEEFPFGERIKTIPHPTKPGWKEVVVKQVIY